MTITDLSKTLAYAGVAAILLSGFGAMIPWRSSRRSTASIQRRIYWTGAAASALLLFAAALPDWRSALFVSLCVVAVMIATAWRFTSHIKIGDRVYEYMRDSRKPDPPPALQSDSE